MTDIVLISLMMVLLLGASSSSSVSVSREGCPDRCGNLSIPYPFGIGPGCSKDLYFEVTCNSSTNPPRAYLQMAGDTPLDIIDVYETSIHVRKLTKIYGYSVYDPIYGDQHIGVVSWNLVGTPYSFSDGNWITVISCDDEAKIFGSFGDQVYSTTCGSSCLTRNDSGGILSCPDDMNIAGSGCCQTQIPRGITRLYVDMIDIHNRRRGGQIGRLFRNGFSFIGGKMKAFNQSSRLAQLNQKFVTNDWLIKNAPQVLLDWRIEAQNCSEARKDASYVCQANTDCVDAHRPIGYLCKCSKGYVGNAYLAPGCQDVDECVDSPCDTKAICTNTQGSFTCSCRKGYRDNGKGCIRHSLSMSTTALIASGVIMVIIISLLISVIIWCHRRRKVVERKARVERVEREEREKREKKKKTRKGLLPNAIQYDEMELLSATDNFSSTRELGSGGQGTVYKGILSDGKVVAIKKMNKKEMNHDSEEDLKSLESFANEIDILSQINHRHVVRLLGCCLVAEPPMIVYEYVCGGTLSQHLYGPTETTLPWMTRLKIAVDLASTIAYLHLGHERPIYHKDLKSDNILLTEDHEAKLCDFGISRLMELDQSQILTDRIGTYGYIDPLVFVSCQYSSKSEVYSFGVILVQLLTGQKARLEGINLADRFLQAKGTEFELMLDARVSKEASKDEIMAFAKLCEKCLNSKADESRPSMDTVAAELRMICQMRVAAEERASTSSEIGPSAS